MKRWQKIWLWIVIFLASIHYLRDTLQDLGIPNILSTSFVKPGHSMVTNENSLPFRIYWAIFNTYTIAVVEIIFASICLYRNKFGNLGNATIVIGLTAICIWLFSWIFLK